VTPTQLYGELLDGHRQKAEGFRYGRSEMQIHFALSESPRWEGDERLGQTAIVHLTPGLDGVSRAVNEAERGLLPAEATVVVGQPLTMDASRAPQGKGLLWIQLQELPWRVKGDAAGQLDVGDGRQLRRVVDADRAAAIRPDHLVLDRWRRGDEIQAELALEALLDDLHVEQAEKPAAEAEPERDRALRLECEGRVVEVELVDRVAQERVVLAGHGVEAREDEAFRLLVAGQRLGRGAPPRA